MLLAILPPCLAAEEPYLVHASDTAPGHTLVLSGGGYNPSTVEVVLHFPGTVLSQRDKIPNLIAKLAEDYDGNPEGLPQRPPDQHTVRVRPLHASEHTVFVPLRNRYKEIVLPPNFVAIVWLKDRGQLSNPVLVNQPQAWYLLKTKNRPGELNRIFGFNLLGDPYVENAVFLGKAGNSPIKLEIESKHQEGDWPKHFQIQFRIPRDLPPGQYEVFVHNNSGNEYGFTESLPLTVVTKPQFSQQLFVATEYGIKGDSFTDNRKALQRLIDKVGATGGGIVFLPPGAYRINDTLQLRSGVLLRGAGRDATTLFYGGKPGDKKRVRWLVSARGVNHTGIENMTIRTSAPFSLAISYYNGGKPTYDTVLRHCRIIGGSVSIHYNVNMEIGNCLFEHAPLHVTSLRHGWVHDNQFTMGRFGGNPVVFWATENCTIEHNRVFSSNRGFVWQQHGKFGHYHNVINANVVEDARMGANAGETFLFEGSGFRWSGKPDAIYPMGFAVKGADWEPGSLQKAFAVITSGRGLGQYRRIAYNISAYVILERPWPVVPEGDVRISIMDGVVENVIANNRSIDSDNSMMFYGAGIINNRIYRNRSENSLGISIWSLADTGKNKLVPDYYNIFQGNVLEDQGGFWLTQRGDIRQKEGVRNLNNIFRDNFLADVRRKHGNQYWNIWERENYRPVQSAFWMGIGFWENEGGQQGPIWIDTLIEHNYITRCDSGVEIGKIGGGTVIHRNTFFAVKLPIIDQGHNTKIIRNQVEQPAFYGPSRNINVCK